jgi:hypothetical protein
MFFPKKKAEEKLRIEAAGYQAEVAVSRTKKGEKLRKNNWVK